MKPVIHSQKHYIQYPIDQITTATKQNIILIDAEPVANVNAANEVVEGASVKAIFIELWLQNTSTLAEQIVTVEKAPAGSAGPSFAQMAALHDFDNKKNILFTHQGLGSNDGVSGPQRVINQWIKIPKGKQRFGAGDRLIMTIANVSSNDLNRCGFSIYKSYT